MAGDFSVIFDPYLWKQLKNDDDDDDDDEKGDDHTTSPYCIQNA